MVILRDTVVQGSQMVRASVESAYDLLLIVVNTGTTASSMSRSLRVTLAPCLVTCDSEVGSETQFEKMKEIVADRAFKSEDTVLKN